MEAKPARKGKAKPAEAAERWPGIRFDTRALFHPDSGRLHADRSVAALQAAGLDPWALER